MQNLSRSSVTQSLAQHSTFVANCSPILQAITAVQCSPVRCLLQWSWRIHKQAATQNEQHLTLCYLRLNASMRFVAQREAGHSLLGLATSCEQSLVTISKSDRSRSGYELHVWTKCCSAIFVSAKNAHTTICMQWLLRHARNLNHAKMIKASIAGRRQHYM